MGAHEGGRRTTNRVVDGVFFVDAAYRGFSGGMSAAIGGERVEQVPLAVARQGDFRAKTTTTWTRQRVEVPMSNEKKNGNRRLKTHTDQMRSTAVSWELFSKLFAEISRSVGSRWEWIALPIARLKPFRARAPTSTPTRWRPRFSPPPSRRASRWSLPARSLYHSPFGARASVANRASISMRRVPATRASASTFAVVAAAPTTPPPTRAPTPCPSSPRPR